jgi:hypothetical protein
MYVKGGAAQPENMPRGCVVPPGSTQNRISKTIMLTLIFIIFFYTVNLYHTINRGLHDNTLTIAPEITL